MGLVYVLNADSSHAPWEENVIRQRLMSGMVSPETFYWREGMTDWRPLRELAASALSAAPTADSAFRLTTSLQPLTAIVQVLLVFYFITAALNLYGAIGQMAFVYEMDVSLDTARSHDSLMRIFAVLSIVIYILTAIPFGMWIYRANRNCQGFARGMKYSSAMAVGGFFIPFANLVIPCAAMQEIWKVSTNPARWQEEKLSVLVGFWWIFWLLVAFTGEFIRFLPKVHNRETLGTTTSVLIGLEILKLVIMPLAFALVTIITRKQVNLTRCASIAA